MHDEPAILKEGSLLAGPLGVCRDVVQDPFEAADSRAISLQRYHRFLTIAAAFTGTAAVIFAILQLGYPTLGGARIGELELVAAGAAGLAVVLGLFAEFQSNWLLKRHVAERLRLAKFAYLIDPRAWSGDPCSIATTATPAIHGDELRLLG